MIVMKRGRPFTPYANRTQAYHMSMTLTDEFDAVAADETELMIDDVIQGVEPRISMPNGWLGVGGSPLYSVCCWRRRMER